MSDSLTSVRMRIAAIQQQMGVAPVQTRPPVAGTTAVAGSSATEFADLLQAASAATAPTDATKFANGRLPDSALVSIGNGERLVPSAAKAFLSLQSDAKAAGVSFGINDSYRSYDQQVDMANRKGLYSQGGLAAKPGTSTHGLGLSVDLQLDAAAQKWMQNNAARHGFVNDVRGESWHWTYKP